MPEITTIGLRGKTNDLCVRLFDRWFMCYFTIARCSGGEPDICCFLVVGAILAYAIYSESKKEDKNRKKLHIMWIICLLIYGVGMGVGIVIGTSWAIDAFKPSSEGSFSLRFGSGSSSRTSRYNGGSSDDIFSVNSADYDKLDREAKYIRDYTNGLEERH